MSTLVGCSTEENLGPPIEDEDRRGRLVCTGSPRDIFATGNSYFALEDENEQRVFARGGRLCVLEDGDLALRTTAGTFVFETRIFIPYDAEEIIIEPDGRVSYLDHDPAGLVDVGQLEAVHFVAHSTPNEALADVVRGAPA
ncbi:MAG: hypothetical protein AAF907_08540 [Planctomycetota bacterium]